MVKHWKGTKTTTEKKRGKGGKKKTMDLAQHFLFFPPLFFLLLKIREHDQLTCIEGGVTALTWSSSLWLLGPQQPWLPLSECA